MKKIKTPTAVTSAGLTLITIFFWAAFEVYRALTIKIPPPVPKEIVNPLDPTLDTQVLNNLSQRLFFQEGDIGNLEVSSLVTATPIATPTATASAKATP